LTKVNHDTNVLLSSNQSINEINQMNLRQIDYALAVAEEGNFTRAAARCHTVQSALSHQIARLEQELGTRLFERSSRHVALSPAGHTFVTYARQVQEAATRLRDEMMAASGEIRGTLTIGTISTLTVTNLPQLLADYHQQHPQVDVRLHVGMSDIMLQEMRDQKTDVAFLGLWPGEPVDGVEAQLLSQEPLVALLHPQHPLAGEQQLSLQQVASQTLVDYQAGTGPRQQTDAAFLAAGIERRVAFEVNHAELLESIIGQGLAIGMIPLHSSAAHRGLITIPVKDAPQRRVYFAWGRNPTPAAAAFQALVSARAKQIGSPL
jgi:DNA-binding transcriptional LysR family regulator